MLSTYDDIGKFKIQISKFLYYFGQSEECIYIVAEKFQY